MNNIEILCNIRHNENLENFKPSMNEIYIRELLKRSSRYFIVKDKKGKLSKVFIANKTTSDDEKIFLYQSNAYVIEEISQLGLISQRDSNKKVIYYQVK